MKRGRAVLEPEPEPGVVICILELSNLFFGAYRILPNSTRFDLQVSGTTKRGVPRPLVQFHRSFLPRGGGSTFIEVRVQAVRLKLRPRPAVRLTLAL